MPDPRLRHRGRKLYRPSLHRAQFTVVTARRCRFVSSIATSLQSPSDTYCLIESHFLHLCLAKAVPMAKAPHIAAFQGKLRNSISRQTIISDINYNFRESVPIQNPLMTLNASLEFCKGRTFSVIGSNVLLHLRKTNPPTLEGAAQNSCRTYLKSPL